MMGLQMKKRLNGIWYLVDFVPYQGYFWKLVENDVVLSEGGPVPTERTARWDMEKVAEDFGLQFPEE
jgi:hypothetical protein